MRTGRNLLLIAACTAALAIAQNGPEMKDLNSVYVRDSGVASERIALAERMERLKEWDKSANVYQEIVEKYADRVIPTRSDANGAIAQYTSVALLVQEKLAKWPAEGLAVYRGRYEQTAKDLLDRAGNDRSALQVIFSQYFATESAKIAGVRLLALSMEQGEFASAAWVGDRMLAHHPSLLTERPTVLFQTALTEHLAGNEVKSKARLEELKTRFPQAAAVVRGQDVILADLLEKEIATQPSLRKTFQSDAWPMAFGNLEASAVPQNASRGGARMFSIDIPLPKPNRVQNGFQQQNPGQLLQQRKLGGMTGILPVVDNGELFFQDNARIYAISLTSGLPLPGWAQTHGGNKRGIYSTSGDSMPMGKPLGLVVTDRFVVSVLGQSGSPNMNHFMQTNQNNKNTQLVCLDRTSGRPAWTALLSKLKIPEDQASVRTGDFCGIPLVVDNTVYVPVRANRGGQFEEIHLVAISLHDGSYLWSSYIASTAGGNMMVDFETGMSAGSFNPILSYTDGRVYILTNLGALACIDATDGKTMWLNIYPRNEDIGSRNRMAGRGFINRSGVATRKPFTQDPPMIVDGRLFVAPADSKDILVYDAASGEEVKRISRELERPKHEAVDMLLAVVGDNMILGNRSSIFSIPWRNYDTEKTIIANGGKFRRLDYGQNDSREEEAIRGRPFVSAQSIYVPVASKLHRMSLDQLMIEESYPQNGVWDEAEEAPGNVLATPDYLIVAGFSRVTAYTDLAVATVKLDEQIKNDPTQAEPFLRYAELYLAGGKSRDAIDWLDKAVVRIAGDDPATTQPSGKALPAGPGRERLFEITCGFGAKLLRTDAATPEVIRQLFARARQSALTPDQQVRYRVAHAAFLRKSGEAAAELALYQEILDQPEWRTIGVAGREGSVTAAVEAEIAIGELLKKNASLYDPYRKQAAEALVAAKAQPDADANSYLSIADRWPLATEATESLLKASALYEAASDFRVANQTLRRLLQRASDSEIRAGALEAMARNYMRMPRQLDLAIVRLNQAAQLQGQRPLASAIPIGKEKIEGVNLEEAARILTAYRTRTAGDDLPSLAITNANDQPDKPPFLEAEALEGVSSIIRQDADARRPDRVVALKSDNTVIELKSGEIKPLANPVKITGTPVGSGYSGDTLIVVTQSGASAIRDGKALWTVPLDTLPGAETTPDAAVDEIEKVNPNRNVANIPGAQIRVVNGRVIRQFGMGIPEQPTGPERISHFRILSDRVVMGTTQGRVVSADLASGKVAWQARPTDSAIRHFEAIDDYIVTSATDQMASTDVFVIDAVKGQVTTKTTFDAQRGAQLMNLGLSRDGVLVMLQYNEIQAIDLFSTDRKPVKRAVGNRNQGEAPFAVNTAPDQLVFTGGSILAVSMSVDRLQSIRIFDLRTLEPARSKDPKTGRTIETNLASGLPVDTRGDGAGASIQAVGPSFYVTGPKSFIAYSLSAGGGFEPHGLKERGTIRNTDLTRQSCLLFHAPDGVRGQKMPSIQLSIFSREKLPSGQESGALVLRPTIQDPAGILADEWQVANDSVYYVSAEKKLKMLKVNP